MLHDNTTLLINTDRPAYNKWTTTGVDKKLYTILIYFLFVVTKELSKKEVFNFLNKFSASLKEQTDKLI